MNSENVSAILQKVDGTLSPEEAAVVELIKEASQAGESITQNQIARAERWMGVHPKHDGHLPPEHDTTVRYVRAIVRDLRLKHGVPILSSRDGYRFPGSKEEAQTYLNRMEREAKARAWSSLETYRGMAKVLSLKSEYFEAVEKQLSLFGQRPKPSATEQLVEELTAT